MLGGGLTRPWLWALEFVFYGEDGVVRLGPQDVKGWLAWRRPALVAYWAGTIVVAVGGWQTRLVRARRIRMKSNGGVLLNNKKGGPDAMLVTSTEDVKVRVESAREEKRVHASLNMRRKFFHALAVTMFVPGIIVDVGNFLLAHDYIC